MFDFSFSEMILAGVVALVVLGPERLPIIARKAGEWLGKIQQLATGVKSELTQHTQIAELAKVKHDLQSTAQEIKQDLHDFGKHVEAQAQSISQEIKPPAWESLPEQKTPADFGVDDLGKPLSGSLKSSPSWHTPSLKKQAMTRKRDRLPKHRPAPKLRNRR